MSPMAEGMIVGKPTRYKLVAEMYTDGSWSFMISGLHNKFEVAGFLATIESMIRDECKKQLAAQLMDGMRTK